jgi:HSP20 family protein
MSLTSFFYEPFYSLSDFDRLFDEAFNARSSDQTQVQRRGAQGQQGLSGFRPRYVFSFINPHFTCHLLTFTLCRLDVHENKETNQVTATFELPGLRKEDVNIDVHNNILTVSGESKVDTQRDEHGYAVRERRYGKFSRSLPLPQGIKVCAFSLLISLYSVVTDMVS